MQIATIFRPLRYLLLSSAPLALLSLVACNSETASVQEDLPEAELAWSHPDDTLDESILPTEKEVGGILKELGYSQFEFEGKSVVVEGDMVLHRSDFLLNSLHST